MQKRVIPVIDDDFVAEISDKKTVPEFRASLAEQLKEKAEQHKTESTRQKLIDALVEQTSFELPEALVSQQLDAMVGNFEQQLRRLRVSLNDYLANSGTSIEDIQKGFLPAAEKAARAYVLIREIADKEEIKAEEKDIDESIDELARYYGADRETVREHMLKDDGILTILWRIVRRKVLDRLEQTAHITVEKTLPFAEMKDKEVL
jgi:trigger factor